MHSVWTSGQSASHHLPHQGRTCRLHYNCPAIWRALRRGRRRNEWGSKRQGVTKSSSRWTATGTNLGCLSKVTSEYILPIMIFQVWFFWCISPPPTVLFMYANYYFLHCSAWQRDLHVVKSRQMYSVYIPITESPTVYERKHHLFQPLQQSALYGMQLCSALCQAGGRERRNPVNWDAPL